MVLVGICVTCEYYSIPSVSLGIYTNRWGAVETYVWKEMVKMHGPPHVWHCHHSISPHRITLTVITNAYHILTSPCYSCYFHSILHSITCSVKCSLRSEYTTLQLSRIINVLGDASLIQVKPHVLLHSDNYKYFITMISWRKGNIQSNLVFKLKKKKIIVVFNSPARHGNDFINEKQIQIRS